MRSHSRDTRWRPKRLTTLGHLRHHRARRSTSIDQMQPRVTHRCHRATFTHDHMMPDNDDEHSQRFIASSMLWDALGEVRPASLGEVPLPSSRKVPSLGDVKHATSHRSPISRYAWDARNDNHHNLTIVELLRVHPVTSFAQCSDRCAQHPNPPACDHV